MWSTSCVSVFLLLRGGSDIATGQWQRLTRVEVTCLNEVPHSVRRQFSPDRILPLSLFQASRQRVEASFVVVPMAEDDVGAFLERLDLVGERIFSLLESVSYLFIHYIAALLPTSSPLSSAQRRRSLVMAEISCSSMNTAK